MIKQELTEQEVTYQVKEESLTYVQQAADLTGLTVDLVNDTEFSKKLPGAQIDKKNGYVGIRIHARFEAGTDFQPFWQTVKNLQELDVRK